MESFRIYPLTDSVLHSVSKSIQFLPIILLKTDLEISRGGPLRGQVKFEEHLKEVIK